MAKSIVPNSAPGDALYDWGAGAYPWRPVPPPAVGEGKLLTLDPANASDTANYIYLNWQQQYVGCFAFPSGLNDNGWNYNEYQPSNIVLSPTPGRAIVTARSQSGDDTRRIAEIQIPTIYEGSTKSQIPNAAVTRALFDVVSAAPYDDGIWAGGTRISGLCVHNGRLVANAYGFYDVSGAGTVKQTTLVIDDAASLGPTNERGFFYAVRTPGDNLGARIAGWCTPIPVALQAQFEGTHIMGHSSGNIRSGASRHSLGPSAFVIDLDAPGSITGASPPADGAEITVEELMNFPLGETTSMTPQSLLQNAGQNWTLLSEAYYGFIVPGTDTYFVVGYSGGHNGTGQTIGYQGTYYPFDSANVDNYYWCFRVSDLLRVKNGEIQPYEMQPYEHGPMTMRWQGTLDSILYRTIRGGYYDPATKLLYVTISSADALNESALCEIYDLSGVAS